MDAVQCAQPCGRRKKRICFERGSQCLGNTHGIVKGVWCSRDDHTCPIQSNVAKKPFPQIDCLRYFFRRHGVLKLAVERNSFFGCVRTNPIPLTMTFRSENSRFTFRTDERGCKTYRAVDTLKCEFKGQSP